MDNILRYILIGLIAILFTGVVFYAANTTFKMQTNRCWETPAVIAKDINYDNSAEMQKLNAEQTKCNNQYTIEQTKNNRNKQILISILSLIVLVIIYFVSTGIVNNGLFFGIIVTNIISTIAYYDAATTLNLALVVIVLIGIILYINKKIKE